MQYVEFPGVDAPVSGVVQGGISLFALDEESRLEMLDAAVEGGITAFDTAVYSAVDRGHIGAWGVSNWTTARIEAAVEYANAHDLRGPVANATIGEGGENIVAEGTGSGWRRPRLHLLRLVAKED